MHTNTRLCMKVLLFLVILNLSAALGRLWKISFGSIVCIYIYMPGRLLRINYLQDDVYHSHNVFIRYTASKTVAPNAPKCRKLCLRCLLILLISRNHDQNFIKISDHFWGIKSFLISQLQSVVFTTRGNSTLWPSGCPPL